MMEDRPRKLAPWKRMLGVLLFTAVILGSATCSYFLVQPDDPPPAEAAQEEPPVLMASFFWLVLGILFCGAGIFAYVVILVTNAFTFNFSKPFWGSLKLKLWFFNIVVLVLPAIGLGFVGRAFLGPVLIGLGLPPPLPDVVPVVGSLLLVQVALMWLNLWAPVEKSCVRRRLGGYGVAGRELHGGWLVGISDPSKSSFKKMAYVEEDLGMLWFRGDQLIYRGDTQGFDVKRDDLLDVERAADAGSVDSLSGAVHVILRFRQEAGAPEDGQPSVALEGGEQSFVERRVRLHPMGCWHASAIAKALERLAARVNAWRQPPPAGAPAVTTPPAS